MVDILPLPLFGSLAKLANAQTQEIPYLIHQSDYQKACQFLINYKGSQATFNSYRREIERLLQWTNLISHKSLSQLRRDDIEKFLEFCQNPPKDWIGVKQAPRFIIKDGLEVPNPEWRLFVSSVSKKERRHGALPNVRNYSFSQSGLQALFAIIGSFYNYLIDDEYLDINPIAQIRQKSKFLRVKASKRPIRRLSELEWQYVIETAREMAEQNPEKHERTLFIMSALYGMYLRISELAASKRWTPLMQHFHRDQENHWWFTTVGKGNKERDISVSDAMLEALKRYRTHLNLSPLPSLNESFPLIPKSIGKGPITETRHIRRIVQDCFDAAIEKLRLNKHEIEADQLASATVHWLRHTGISDDVKYRPREHVRDDAGHSSSAITDRYIDVERQKRHASARKKKI